LYMKQRRWTDAMRVLPRPSADSQPVSLDLELLRIEAAAYDAVEQGGNTATAALEKLSSELAAVRKEHPDNAEAAMVQSIILTSQGRADAAEAELKTAIRACKDPLRLELQLARIYSSRNRPDESLTAAQAACRNH